MSNRAWMPLHIADYLADTGHLTATEHGAYLLLIMHYWQNGALPENERVIARIAKMTADQWEESRDILAMLFGPGWTHKRIDAELSKADEIIEKRRAAAEARYSKGKTQTSDANAMHVQSKSNDTGVPPTTGNHTSSLRSEDAPAPKKQKATRLPEDWSLPRAWGQWAVSEGFPEQTIRLEAAKFRDFWCAKSGKDATKLDWFATWRNWIRNCSKSQPGHGPPANQRTMSDAIDDFIRNHDHELSAGTTIDHDGGDYSPNVHLLASPARR